MTTFTGFDVLPSGTWDCGAGGGEWSSGGCDCGSSESCGCGGECGGCSAAGCFGGGPGTAEIPRLPDYDGQIWSSNVKAVASLESQSEFVGYLSLLQGNQGEARTLGFGEGASGQSLGAPSFARAPLDECVMFEGSCDGCWPILSWDLDFADGMFTVPRIIDADALLPDSSNRYQDRKSEMPRGPVLTYAEKIDVAVTRNSSKPGKCKPVGRADCKIVKGCAFDLQLTLDSRSADTFEVVGSGNHEKTLKPLAKGVKAVFREEVACGDEAKLRLKRAFTWPPGVIELADPDWDTEISIGYCDRCYKRC